MDIKLAIGNRIKELRSKTGLSQEEFADIASIDRTYVTRLETGKRNVTLQSLQKIIKALNTTYCDFFNHPSFKNNNE
ncbi:MAG: helix-turn-helix domain-containing protein [Bacteriovoracia bacterium]